MGPNEKKVTVALNSLNRFLPSFSNDDNDVFTTRGWVYRPPSFSSPLPRTSCWNNHHLRGRESGLRILWAYCDHKTRNHVFCKNCSQIDPPPFSQSPTRLFLFRWSCNMSKCCFRNRKNNILLFITTCFCNLAASIQSYREFLSSHQIRGGGGVLWRALNDSTVNGYEVVREMNVFEFSFHFFSLPCRRHHDDDFLRNLLLNCRLSQSHCF